MEGQLPQGGWHWPVKKEVRQTLRPVYVRVAGDVACEGQVYLVRRNSCVVTKQVGSTDCRQSNKNNAKCACKRVAGGKHRQQVRSRHNESYAKETKVTEDVRELQL